MILVERIDDKFAKGPLRILKTLKGLCQWMSETLVVFLRRFYPVVQAIEFCVGNVSPIICLYVTND